MIRALVPALLLAVMALAGPPAVLAQQKGDPPTKLWDEFPLEPSVTPYATQQQQQQQQPQQPQQRTVPPNIARTRPTGGMGNATLIGLMLAAAALGSLTAWTAARRRPGRASPTPEAATPEAVAPEAVAPPRAGGRPRRAKPRAKPAKRRATPDAPQAKHAAFEPERAAPEPERAAPEPERAEPPEPQPAVPAAERASRFQRVAPAPSAETAGAPDVAPGGWEECRIKIHSLSMRSYFFAVPHEGGPELARSPYFRTKSSESGAMSAAEALRALVGELTAAGWRQTGAGRAPWDLRFAWAPRPQSPVAPRRSG